MMSVPPEIDCSGTSPDGFLDPVELPVVQHGPGGQHGAQPAEVDLGGGPVSRRPGTAAGTRGLVPKTVTPWSATSCHRVSGPLTGPSYTTMCAPDGQRRELPVPHHPGGGGVEVEDVVGAQVTVQPVLLDVLEQRAAGAVHHRLRWAGGPRREHDPQRMVERQSGPGLRRRSAGAAATSSAQPVDRRRPGTPAGGDRPGRVACRTAGRPARSLARAGIRAGVAPIAVRSTTSRTGSTCSSRPSSAVGAHVRRGGGQGGAQGGHGEGGDHGAGRGWAR